MFDLNHGNFILHTIFQTISLEKNHRSKIIDGTSKNRNTKYQKLNFNETSIPAKQKI